MTKYGSELIKAGHNYSHEGSFQDFFFANTENRTVITKGRLVLKTDTTSCVRIHCIAEQVSLQDRHKFLPPSDHKTKCITRDMTQMKLHTDHELCLTYGQSLLMKQWTFHSTCDQPAHSAWTLHAASGSKLCHQTLLCGIIPSSWHGILPLLGCQYSPPPSAVGSAMLHPRHHPLFVSLRFSLARRQCPFLGTKYWKETAKRNQSQSFASQSSPVSRRPPWTDANLFWVFF